MNIEADYSAAWRDLKKRRLIAWGMFLGFVPSGFATFFLIGLPLSFLTGIRPDYFFYPISISWMLMIWIAGQRAMTFRCPRCQQRFFAARWYYNVFARRRVHCKLRIGADSN
jgi:hypothetical protein